MKKIDSLVLDMDGTLLRSDVSVSPEDLSAIKKAIEEGIDIIVASGRPYQNLPESIRNLPNRYSIQRNGALVVDWINGHKPIRSQLIRNERAVEVLKDLVALDIYISCSAPDEAFIEARNYEKLLSVRPNSRKNPSILHDDIIEAVRASGKDLENIWTFCFTEESMYQELALNEKYPDLNIQRTNVRDVAVTDGKANKKDALIWLLDYLGRNKSTLAAMGDGDNDLEVLKLAKVSFAPANATDLIKANVDHVVASNDENGVCEAINMILDFNRRCL